MTVCGAEEACRRGDLEGLRAALGNPEGFPNCVLAPEDLALGDRPLDLAILHGTPDMLRRLLALGADPNAPATDGFPALFKAMDAPRPDRHEILAILLAWGADTSIRGINDWTALHHAVARRDLESVRRLLTHGADPNARTRIDDLSTPLEDAEATGFAEAAEAMQAASAARSDADSAGGAAQASAGRHRR